MKGLLKKGREIVGKGKVLPSSSVTNSSSSLTPVSSVPLITSQGVPNAEGYINSFITKKEEVYYGEYSGESASGRFLTKTPPNNSFLVQEGLALPLSNTAQLVQEVIVPAGTRLQRSRALPTFGKRGGMEQFQIFEKDLTKITFKDGVPFQ